MIENYNYYALNYKEKVLFFIILIFSCASIGFLFYDTVLFVIIIPFIYKKCKSLYEESKVRKRRKQLTLEFKDFLFLVSSSLATGMHMINAMNEAKAELNNIYPNSYMASELEVMINVVKETGETDISVLGDFAKRSGLEDIEDFVSVYRVCRETGGNMIYAVNNAATIIADKITIEKEIETISQQKLLEGKIITAMPICIIVFLRVMSKDYISILYESLQGHIIMSFALCVTVISYFAIERITNIEV